MSRASASTLNSRSSKVRNENSTSVASPERSKMLRVLPPVPTSYDNATHEAN